MKRKNSYEDDQNPTKKARTGNNEGLIQDSAASAEEKQLAENGDNIGLDFLELPMEIILAIMHHLNFDPKGEDDYVQLIHNCDMLSQTCKELNVICRDLLEEHLKGVEDLKLMHLSMSRNSIWTRANFAAYNGYFSRLLFARETGSRWDEKTCAMAAMGGQIKILAYLHENGCRWSSDTTARAAMNGHIDCLSYALENGCSLDNVAYSLAAKHGQLTVLQYLHEHGHPWKEDVCFNAVKYGHFSCLKYAHEHGCGWNSVYICREAVLSGRLEVLQYLHEKGTEWHEVVTDLSASLGHFEMLIYAYENGCPFSDNVCTRAAAGNLECLIYVHENGAEWNEETCYAAASYGSLECLRYAHENGAYWDYKACDVATDLCRLDCVEYMHENGIQCRHTAPHLYALGLFEEQ